MKPQTPKLGRALGRRRLVYFTVDAGQGDTARIGFQRKWKDFYPPHRVTYGGYRYTVSRERLAKILAIVLTDPEVYDFDIRINRPMPLED